MPAASDLTLAAAILLGGCTLVDQNTFNPRAGDAPVVPVPVAAVVAPPVPGPPPLLVIAPGTTGDGATGYADALGKAVAAARARKAGVVFDVVEVARQDAAADGPLGANAAAVARGIVGQGIPPDRVRLVLRPDPAGKPGEVRVFVR